VGIAFPPVHHVTIKAVTIKINHAKSELIYTKSSNFIFHPFRNFIIIKIRSLTAIFSQISEKTLNLLASMFQPEINKIKGFIKKCESIV